MWEGSGGRSTVFPWSDAPGAIGHETPAYAVGNTVYSGACRGTVVSVDAFSGHNLISVVWSDGDGGEIIYPADATYLRKGLPWE